MEWRPPPTAQQEQWATRWWGTTSTEKTAQEREGWGEDALPLMYMLFPGHPNEVLNQREKIPELGEVQSF